MPKKTFTPFFVADRQASLKIIAGLRIPKEKNIGLMTHANTHENFQTVFKSFPCIDAHSCPVIGNNKCSYNRNLNRCSKGRRIKNQLITICDSGVFTKDGCQNINYRDLFSKYNKLDVDYGIITDVLKDKNATLINARKAMNLYKRKRWKFKLLGVAQGNTIQDYLECYTKLKNMGFKYIAIGGMLHKKENSARYVHVRDEAFLNNVIHSIREFDSKGQLFALGCYSPKRHHIFLRNDIFGSDYKGWIFQYSGHSKNKGDKRAQKRRFLQVRTFIETKVLQQSQEWGEKYNLMIIPCSKTKISRSGRVKAINLYDGPLFRLIKKHVKDFSNNNGLDILILSAKYGLISPNKKIYNYNQLMTNSRSIDLQNQIQNQFNLYMEKKQYSNILINLGKHYFNALEPTLDNFSCDASIVIIEGRIGERLREVKKWLQDIS